MTSTVRPLRFLVGAGRPVPDRHVSAMFRREPRPSAGQRQVAQFVAHGIEQIEKLSLEPRLTPRETGHHLGQAKIGRDHAGAGQKGWIMGTGGGQVTGHADTSRDKPEDFDQPFPRREHAFTRGQPPLAKGSTSLIQPSLIG